MLEELSILSWIPGPVEIRSLAVTLFQAFQRGKLNTQLTDTISVKSGGK